MAAQTFDDDLRRFLMAIPSIPYLEAMLLLRSAPEQEWETVVVARRLYMDEAQTAELLRSLCKAFICVAVESRPGWFQYRPQSAELADLIDRLAALYAGNLIEITHIIHAKSDRKQRIRAFADAFKWRKEQ